ncbi:hypothetical protein FGO68_gene7029 [Halteria grandinella]|uniref:Uncharacterized protein n=1 Tax=Halteria grandinella TaxID=5974 RepID=A0A8J8SYZ2_HALGN|nr:hypothetical protein FGO68_gene7029 [Halteria grandinella]
MALQLVGSVPNLQIYPLLIYFECADHQSMPKVVMNLQVLKMSAKLSRKVDFLTQEFLVRSSMSRQQLHSQRIQDSYYSDSYQR